MKKIFFVLVILFLCVSAEIGHAQENRTLRAPETYIETVVDSSMLQLLAQEFSVDWVHRNPDNTFNTRICLSAADFNNFRSIGIPYTTIQPTRATVTMANSYADMINGWNKYPTYSTYLAMMDTFQTRYPNLCKIDTILASTPGGRKILCAHISNNLNDNQGTPSLLYISTMHGDEVVGYYFMLRLIDMLLTNYNTNTKITNLVNNIDIWICPLYNPDGTYHSGNNTINSSPTSTRYNYNSVDLNRTFPDAGSTIGSNYEPEVSAMMAFMGSHNFTLAANFHGGAQLFNYPWDIWTSSQRSHADAAWWNYVGRKYVDTCQTFDSSYMTEEGGVTEGGDWYVINGSMQDYHNWYLGTRHVTIEVGPKVVNTSTLPSYWGKAYHSLLNFMEEANYGIHGIVTDSLTGEPLKARVYIENHDVDHSYVETELPYGDYHRPIKAGQYSITYSANGYFSKTIVTNVSDEAKLTQNVRLLPRDMASGDWIEIGSGTTTTNYIPTRGQRNYSLTQQIYTVDELGTAGDILSIEFYKSNAVGCNRNVDIYMVSTTKSSFSSNSDWIHVSSLDKVYSGTVNFSSNDWTTIELNTPFSYDGINNVAIIVDDNTGSSSGSFNNYPSFRTFSTSSSQAIYYNSNSSNYNPTSSNLGNASGRLNVKNQIRVFIASNECPKITAADLPYNEDFESYTPITEPNKTGVMPECWTLAYEQYAPMADTAKPQIFYGDNRPHTGDYCLYMFGMGILAMPELGEDVDITTLKMGFWLRQHKFITQLQVGVMSDLSDESTFTPLGTYDNGSSTEAHHYVVDFSQYTGTDNPKYIAFRNIVAPGYTQTRSVQFIDDISIYVTGSEDDPEHDMTCSISVPYDQGFEAGDPELDCWTFFPDDPTAVAPKVVSANAQSGTNSLYTTGMGIYALPELEEGTDLSSLSMTFHVMQRKYAHRILVGVLEENGDFTEIANIYNEGNYTTPVPHTVNFAGYGGNGRRIAFRNIVINTNSVSYNWLDDIHIFETLVSNCGIEVTYEQGFEMANDPELECWTFIAGTENAVAPRVVSTNANSGDNCLYTTGLGIYALPEITNVEDLTNISMTFSVRQRKYAHRIAVGVLESDGAFTVIAEIYNGGVYNAYVEHTVEFSSYTGSSKRIAFQNFTINTNSVSYNWIDDITISLISTEASEPETDVAQNQSVDSEDTELDSYEENGEEPFNAPNAISNFSAAQLSLYPNPTSGKVTLVADEVTMVEVYSQIGSKVASFIMNNERVIDLGNLPKGVYILRVTMPQSVAIRKVVKN